MVNFEYWSKAVSVDCDAEHKHIRTNFLHICALIVYWKCWSEMTFCLMHMMFFTNSVIFMLLNPWFLPNCGLQLGWVFVPMVTRQSASSQAQRLSIEDLRMPQISDAPTVLDFTCRCKNMSMLFKKTIVQV